MPTRTISLEEPNYEKRYPSLTKRWLTPDDMLNEFGFSKSTQAKMRMVSNRSKLPFSKVGKYIRYDRYQIDKWLEEHQIQGVA